MSIVEYISSLTLWNYIETLTLITNLIYVYLIARENVWGWPFGILGSALLAMYSWYSDLPFQAMLNFFYVATGAWGWWQWKYGGEDDSALPIVFGGIKANIAIIVLSALITWGLIWKLQTPDYTGYLMYLEIGCSVFAVPVTLMITRKWIENWVYWVLIDICTIILYLHQDSYQIAGLYGIYILMSIMGYYDWYKKMPSSKEQVQSPT